MNGWWKDDGQKVEQSRGGQHRREDKTKVSKEVGEKMMDSRVDRGRQKKVNEWWEGANEWLGRGRQSRINRSEQRWKCKNGKMDLKKSFGVGLIPHCLPSLSPSVPLFLLYRHSALYLFSQISWLVHAALAVFSWWSKEKWALLRCIPPLSLGCLIAEVSLCQMTNRVSFLATELPTSAQQPLVYSSLKQGYPKMQRPLLSSSTWFHAALLPYRSTRLHRFHTVCFYFSSLLNFLSVDSTPDG